MRTFVVFCILLAGGIQAALEVDLSSSCSSPFASLRCACAYFDSLYQGSREASGV
jgi:hypothetical protein